MEPGHVPGAVHQPNSVIQIGASGRPTPGLLSQVRVARVVPSISTFPGSPGASGGVGDAYGWVEKTSNALRASGTCWNTPPGPPRKLRPSQRLLPQPPSKTYSPPTRTMADGSAALIAL